MAGISNALDGTEDDVIWQEAEIADNDVESSASESESCLSSDDGSWNVCKILLRGWHYRFNIKIWYLILWRFAGILN
jgi:hypothetical protein